MMTEFPETLDKPVAGRLFAPVIGSASFLRLWDMPNRDTFSIPSIEGFVKKYLLKSKCSIDPFARNKRWATHTNDLNPETAAEHHMDSLDFLKMLRDKGVRPDLVIFDPPYNPAQAKECYEQLGMNLPARVGRAAGVWAHEKNVVKEMMADDGVFLWFGWNTCGMAEARGFVIEEIMLVAHGRGHHDTICMAERRRKPEATLWTQNATKPTAGIAKISGSSVNQSKPRKTGPAISSPAREG